MSIKFFDIDIPVFVREAPDEGGKGGPSDAFLMTVRIVMGSAATARDAVEELSRKLEEASKTIDAGDET